MEHDIRVLKLVTGEELIGVVAETASGWLVRQPLALGINHQEGKLVFVPYMPYTSAGEEVHIYRDSLLQEPTFPVESITNDYLEATGQKPKIFMPSKQPILTPVK